MSRLNMYFVGLLALHLTLAVAMAGDGIIHNDTVWHDTQGQEIWANGGYMVRERDVFYWVGYETAPGRPWKINLYSSANLADWKFQATILRNEGEFAKFGWAGRPALLHNRATGKYVLIFEGDCREWQRHKVGFASCDTIGGSYRLVGAEYPEPDRSTGDQSVYQEGDDGYLVCTMDRVVNGRRYVNQSLAIFKLTADFQGIERKVYEGFDNVNGDRSVVPRDQSSREASHIIKVGGVYYWFSSGLEGWNSSATKYATAKSLAGPWSQLNLLGTEPPTKDSFNTQHDFVIPVVGNDATTYLYVGDRYSQWTGKGTGRNIFLPLIFTDGTPALRWLKDWRIDISSGQFFPVADPASQPAP